MTVISDQIKNRIVGAVVIVVAFGLMVLFLVKDKQDQIETMAPIPTKPLLPELEVDPVKKINVQVDDILSEDLTEEVVNQQRKHQLAAQREATTTTSNQSPVRTSDGNPVETVKAQKTSPVLQTDSGENIAWILKVGSFSKATNANKLMATLRNNGYTAYVKPPATEDGLYRLFVGPVLRKEEIARYKQEIDSAHKVKSQVLRYRATSR